MNDVIGVKIGVDLHNRFIIACTIFVFIPIGGKIMLSPQLRKIKIQLEEGATNIDIDKEELLAELNEMEAIQGVLLESLSLSTKVCPTCGKRL